MKAAVSHSVFLCLGGSTDRAGFGTGTAFNAGFRIDFILAVAFADRGNRTFSGTGTAADAIFGNFVSHWKILLILITLIRDSVSGL